MLKKTITYQDIDGNEVTEDFYFHLTKAELVKAEVSKEGGMQEYLQQVIKSKNPREILDAFEGILHLSFGTRVNGKFLKREEDWEVFKSSEAYSELFFELVNDANYAAQFVQGILPAGATSQLVEQIERGVEDRELPEVTKEQELPAESTNELTAVDEEVPAWIRENRDPTKAEVRNMTSQQLQDAYMRKVGG